MSSEVETYLKDLEQPDEATVKEAKPVAKTGARGKVKGPPWTHYARKPIRYVSGCVYGGWRLSVTGGCLGGLNSYIEEAAIIRIYDYPRPCANGNRLVVCVHN